MNEIKKLYELAGIEPIVRDCAVGKGYYIEHSRIEEYLPFTAEKQLRILMLLTKTGKLELENWDYKGFNFTYIGNPSRKNNFIALTGETFEDGYCKLLNTLWQDLTETEQEEIRKILKG